MTSAAGISPVVRYALVGSVSLAIWLIVVWLYVRMGQPPLKIIYEILFIVGVYAGFLWSSLPLFAEQSGPGKWVVRVVSSGLVMAIWLLISTCVAIAFQLAIGGTL
ncbi:hypothetical protein [Lysobacter sp. CA196]|uniref:hypothetical protein n=1 Tax=Lysobacter sp. CA196 TaxID=3455606 RepID=UPI003F8D8450